MQNDIFHVDAFTDRIFQGNPAIVCLLPAWPSDGVLQKIAKENNQPVTTFLVCNNKNYAIRWMTPEYELDLCGHGTLSAAFVIFNYLEPTNNRIELMSQSDVLSVSLENDLITLQFPAKKIEQCSIPFLEDGLGLKPKELYQQANERLLVIFDTEEAVQRIHPNMDILKKLEHRGIIVTAQGKEVDFVSRTFYPKKSTPEDSVTGASHCLLVPYWAKYLNRTKLHAKQISPRGGELFCEYQNNLVFISGKCVLYMKGKVEFEMYLNTE